MVELVRTGRTPGALAREFECSASTTGFRVEILEKVTLLLDLLDGFNRHPYLEGRLALKGGTALNLFVFDVPRLSIDIDLNYVGQLDREAMLAERPEVERALGAVCRHHHRPRPWCSRGRQVAASVGENPRRERSCCQGGNCGGERLRNHKRTSH